MNQKVYDKALRLLNIRLHSTGELYQKLKLRRFHDHDIRAVLRHLEELDFLNDERFAQIFVDNLKRYKDWGYYGIKAKLLQKKIPSDVAEGALKEFYSPDEEESVARRLVGKLKRQGRDTPEKLMRSLSRKGFRSEVVRRAIQIDNL